MRGRERALVYIAHLQTSADILGKVLDVNGSEMLQLVGSISGPGSQVWGAVTASSVA